MRNKSALAKSAFRFVLIIGIVNLLADFTYEGGRAVTGPFLGSLGASAAVIGFVAGFGEFVGYALRSISGYFADKTHRYWPFAFAGYALNQLAIPALALVTNWLTGSMLVVAERTGRAIRKPAMDAMLSHAGESIGAGWVFGLNEALDQAGATAGPLLIAYILSSHGSYRMGFGVFLVPAILCLVTVVVARLLYPRPHELETRKPETPSTKNLTQPFWMYLVAGALIAAGLADFSLIGFHFQKANIVAPNVIPIFYAAAMATSALSGLVFGRLFDRFGSKIAVLAFFLSAGYAPFVFGEQPDRRARRHDSVGDRHGRGGLGPARSCHACDSVGQTWDRIRFRSTQDSGSHGFSAAQRWVCFMKNPFLQSSYSPSWCSWWRCRSFF